MKYRRRGRRYPEAVNEKFPVASVAALIADASRAAILTALLDGRAASAGELARAANASA